MSTHVSNKSTDTQPLDRVMRAIREELDRQSTDNGGYVDCDTRGFTDATIDGRFDLIKLATCIIETHNEEISRVKRTSIIPNISSGIPGDGVGCDTSTLLRGFRTNGQRGSKQISEP